MVKVQMYEVNIIYRNEPPINITMNLKKGLPFAIKSTKGKPIKMKLQSNWFICVITYKTINFIKFKYFTIILCTFKIIIFA